VKPEKAITNNRIQKDQCHLGSEKKKEKKRKEKLGQHRIKDYRLIAGEVFFSFFMMNVGSPRSPESADVGEPADVSKFHVGRRGPESVCRPNGGSMNL